MNLNKTWAYRVQLIFLKSCSENLSFHNLKFGEQTWKHMGQQIYPAHTGFSLLGDGGRRGVPPPVENLLIHPHLENFPPTKSQSPPCPTKQRFSSYFNFILFGHIADVNFDLNWCSAFTENRFQLWKRFESSKLFLIRFPSSSKKIPPPLSKISDSPPPPPPLTAIWKTLS